MTSCGRFPMATMMRMLAASVAVAFVVPALLGGCGARQRSHAARTTAVDSRTDAVVTVGGDARHPLTVAVRPGQVAQKGSISSEAAAEAPPVLAGFTAAGQPVRITFNGMLAAPLTLAFGAGDDHRGSAPDVLRYDAGLGWYPIATGDVGGVASASRDRFSPHLPGWVDIGDWVSGQVDAARRWLTGRTTPPTCTRPAPGWARLDAPTLDVLLTCLTDNPLDGVDRAEIVVKNHRGLTQEITIPPGVAYAAVEGQPERIRQLVRTLASGADVVLLSPGDTMTVGFTQPAADRTVELTPHPSALALAGDLVFQLADLAKEPGKQGRVAALLAVAKCYGANGEKLAGVIPTGLDAVTDLIKAVVACVAGRLAEPGAAVGLALDMLSVTTGLGRDVLMSDEALAPKVDALAGRLAFFAKLAKGADLVRLAGLIWEGVGEQIGRARSGPDPATARLSLTGSQPRINTTLEPLLGTWQLNCSFTTQTMVVTRNAQGVYQGIWKLSTNGTSTEARMHFVVDKGVITGIIDSSTEPSLAMGRPARFVLTNGNNELSEYHDGAGGAELGLFRAGHQDPGFCPG
jgi:hypothetical protein